MSKQHPVVAVTGSSGAGTTTVKRAFEHIFTREGINAAVVEGDSFHRYERAEMKVKMTEEHLSHFGPEANRFDKLEELFKTYGETGTGEKRYYLHNDEEAAEHNCAPGHRQEGRRVHPLGADSRGHRPAVLRRPARPGQRATTETSPHTSTSVSVWCRSSTWSGSRRSTATTPSAATRRRRWSTPSCGACPTTSVTSRRSSRAPTSTSSASRWSIPRTPSSRATSRPRTRASWSSVSPIPKKFDTDFQYLLSMISGSFMSRRNSIVVPGGKMSFAMEIIFGPIIHQMMDERGI